MLKFPKFSPIGHFYQKTSLFMYVVRHHRQNTLEFSGTVQGRAHAPEIFTLSILAYFNVYMQRKMQGARPLARNQASARPLNKWPKSALGGY